MDRNVSLFSLEITNLFPVITTKDPTLLDYHLLSLNGNLLIIDLKLRRLDQVQIVQQRRLIVT
jgi:hypothetical protein